MKINCGVKITISYTQAIELQSWTEEHTAKLLLSGAGMRLDYEAPTRTEDAYIHINTDTVNYLISVDDLPIFMKEKLSEKCS